MELVQNTNSSSALAITCNIPMFIKIVILTKIKIHHFNVNSLLLVSNEIFNSLFVPKIPTLRRDFYLSDKLPNPLRDSRIVPVQFFVTQSENSYFAQDNSEMLSNLTLCRTYILSNKQRILHKWPFHIGEFHNFL